MHYEFCTILTASYVPRGLVLYRSLVDVCPRFRLRVLCMDNECSHLLRRMALPNVMVIPREELEANDPELRAVKPTRSEVEYSWTAIPALPHYLLEREPELEMITRLDADLMFLSDPAPIFEELGQDSVLIVPHRFSPRFRVWGDRGGIYNTQFETFRRDQRGLAALRWWRERCIEWCYDRVEDERWGDQKYLDDWPTRFPGVHVLAHVGAGLAPWNSDRYQLEARDGSVVADGQPVIFYHYQSLQVYKGMTALRRLGLGKRRYRLSRDPDVLWAVRPDYALSEAEERLLWRPYLRRLAGTMADVRRFDPAFPASFIRVGPTAAAQRAARRLLPRGVRDGLRRGFSRLMPTRRSASAGHADRTSFAATVTRAVRALSPPILLAAARRLRSALRRGQGPDRPEWELVPEGWARQQSDPSIKGWNVESVLDTQRTKWAAYVEAIQSPSPLGVSHDIPLDWDKPITTDDYQSHNTLVSYAYVLALACRGKERISILDWGGGIGHYYELSKALVPDVDLSYHCKDVPLLCERGRTLFQHARFYEDDSCFERSYDLVLASGSLQYSQDWAGTVAALASSTNGYLYITRLPLAERSASFVVLQRAYAYGYDTEYLSWVLNRDDFLAAVFSGGMSLVREFLLMEHFEARGAPEGTTRYGGFLFRREEEKDAS